MGGSKDIAYSITVSILPCSYIVYIYIYHYYVLHYIKFYDIFIC